MSEYHSRAVSSQLSHRVGFHGQDLGKRVREPRQRPRPRLASSPSPSLPSSPTFSVFPAAGRRWSDGDTHLLGHTRGGWWRGGGVDTYITPQSDTRSARGDQQYSTILGGTNSDTQGRGGKRIAVEEANKNILNLGGREKRERKKKKRLQQQRWTGAVSVVSSWGATIKQDTSNKQTGEEPAPQPQRDLH